MPNVSLKGAYKRLQFTQIRPGKATLTPVISTVCPSQPMKPLKAAATTSQPVLTVAQIETIFFKVPELYEIHREFYDGLLPRVQQWSHHQRVGDLFQKLVRKKREIDLGVVVCVSVPATAETSQGVTA